MPLDAVGGDVDLQPVDDRRLPCREDHGTRADLARRCGDRLNPLPADRHRRGGHAGAHRRQPVGKTDKGAQRVDPGLMPDQRTAQVPGQAGDQSGDLGRVEPLHVLGLMRGQAARIGSQADPVKFDQAEAAGRDLLEVAPSLQAGALHVDKCLRVAPLVGFGDQKPGSTAGGAGAQPSGLDQLHRSEPGVVRRCGDGHAENPAADDQNIRARVGDCACAAAQHGPLIGG